jgi:hypothetical protein
MTKDDIIRMAREQGEESVNTRHIRGSGRTTQQLQAAARGSVFIWCSRDTHYPKMLAEKIGRSDLIIVGPSWLEHGWIGVEISGLTIDHAAVEVLSAEQRSNISHAVARIRRTVSPVMK